MIKTKNDSVMEINLKDIDYYVLNKCEMHDHKYKPGVYTIELTYTIIYKNGDVKELHIPCLDMSFLTHLPNIHVNEVNFLMGLHELHNIGTKNITLKNISTIKEK